MDLECGYCGGEIEETGRGYVHATTAERVKVTSPGDFVSGNHNVAGTLVPGYDIVEREECS